MAILKALAPTIQTLDVRRDALLLLDLSLDIIDSVRRLVSNIRIADKCQYNTL